MELTSNNLFKFIKEALSSHFNEIEAVNFAYYIMEDGFSISKKNILLDSKAGLTTEVFDQIKIIIKRLKQNEPIQYILGKAHFYGREFKVNPAVLIPRPETEELVHLIINDIKKKTEKIRIFDVCTGSGCIPITLKAELPFAETYGLDISPEALQIAQENSIKLIASTEFIQSDILKHDIPEKDLDVIVSNPPYVRESEKKYIKGNVLDYEPELALFVKDEDPLIFYRNIAAKAKKVLKHNAKIYFEINEALADDVKNLLILQNFQNIQIIKDMQGKDRIIKAIHST